MTKSNQNINHQNKQQIIEILTKSFRDNKSTNFVIKQDHKREARLKKLIEYSIFNGERFGQVYLSEDRNSCAIIIDTERKKITFRSLMWDLRLLFMCIGLKNIKKVLKREALIKASYPKEEFIHLWYVGVTPTEQGKGLGTNLIKEIIASARSMNKPVYLETSTERNFEFYKKLGFEEITTIDQLGYSLKLFYLK